MHYMTEENFIEECSFAKVVESASGPAILVAGYVFEIKATPTALEHVTSLVTALRRQGRGHSESAGSTASFSAANLDG
jgi:hypothetical protein